MRNLVVVAEHLRHHEALAIAAELELHGIAATVLDSSHVETSSAFGMIPMGIVKVSAEDEIEAIRIIEAFEKRKPEDDPEEGKEWRQIREKEAVAQRALVAALAGLLCIPYVFQLYSVAILGPLRSDYHLLGKAARGKIFLALFIDFAVFVAAGIALWTSEYPILGVIAVAVPLVVGFACLAPRKRKTVVGDTFD